MTGLASAERAPRVRGWTVHVQSRTAVLLVGLWVALVAGTTLAHPDFFASNTFLAIAYTMAVVGVLAVGASVVALSGGQLDLSAAAVATGAAVLTATTLRSGVPSGIVVVAAVTVGASFGALNGGLVAFAGLNPIVATLGSGFVLGGIVANLTRSTYETVPGDTALRSFGLDRLLGLPLVFWVLLVVLLATEAFLLRTRAGAHVFATGGNRVAAQRRGVRVRAVQLWAFAFSGACAGLGGVLLAAQSDVLVGTVDAALQFKYLAAVLVGGIALMGGRGRLLGLLASLLLLSTIPTSLVTLRLSSAWELTVEGAALVVAVGIDALRTRRRR